MKEKIVRIDKGREGVALPEDFLRFLELIPGAEVEVQLDKKNKWLVIRPVHGEDFTEHFKDSMDSMA
ncbi:MAG: hypothetical protein AABY51_05570 [Deltaproteobacteria bacterium]